MAVFKVQAPDGTVIKVEANDRATAIRGAQEHYASRQTVQRSGGNGQGTGGGQTLSGLILGRKPGDTPGYRAAAKEARQVVSQDRSSGPVSAFGQGMLFGFGDELEGAGDAASTWVKNRFGVKTPYTPGEAYRAGRDVVRETSAQFNSDHPIASTALTIAGALTGPGAARGARYITRAPNAVSALGRVARVGGAQGALAGAGNAQGGIKERLKGAAIGGAIGAGSGVVLQAGGSALASAGRRVMARAPSPARQLSQAGVQLTPGQMAGGVLRRAEDAATSVPILGDAIRSARTRGIESFDRAAYNRILTPIGEELPTGINVGRDALQHAEGRVSDAYARALQPVNVIPDEQFATEVQAVLQTPNLPAAIRAELGDIVQNSVNGRMGNGVDGATWKAIDSELGAMARAADNASAQQPTSRYLRDGIRRLQEAHSDLLTRTDPAAAAAVQQADNATVNLVRVRQAAQATGARNGVFSPAQLHGAIRATDTSAGNRQFARGSAPLQDLTDSALDVLPQTVPDSGTPFRSLMTVGGLSGGGMAVGARPEAVAAGLTGLTLGAGAYSRPVQDGLNAVYRATTPGQARVALGRLGELAARYPEAAPLYDALVHRLPTADDQRTQPQGQQ